MRFYFYLYGNETGYLKISTKRKKQYTKEQVVFTRFGNHGHKWNLAQIYLDFSPTDVYQVLHCPIGTISFPGHFLVGLVCFFFGGGGGRAGNSPETCWTVVIGYMNLLMCARCLQI